MGILNHIGQLNVVTVLLQSCGNVSLGELLTGGCYTLNKRCSCRFQSIIPAPLDKLPFILRHLEGLTEFPEDIIVCCPLQKAGY